ncbi:NAD-dependent deacetylase sir2D [Hondaea fermentalgiana]|uniref:NAD-dependent deacetylase sir2D n=1 Tax=Hondaea fermentalgiana TaxID=2315210 RepID=A0A2R5GK27_9STRA|nr:NAD-dependent deacetylase sir2D [Hondaea fermentalgiana]|eukprot:GBG30078.1 NAD-dependent deacetylase sir2D [Hondaea fermentalgiana]
MEAGTAAGAESSKKRKHQQQPQAPSQSTNQPKRARSAIAGNARTPLKAFATPADVVRALRNAKHVVVLVGAGISQSCGIPDFRSPAGIYALVENMDLGLPQAECLFDKSYFEDDPEPFYKFAHILYPETAPTPSRTHYFLRQLEVAGKLGRVYTQNIDGLEEAAGIRRAVQCHGTLSKAHCLRCRRVCKASAFMADVRQGRVAECPRKNCDGVLKPAITFFGERVDAKVETRLAADATKADLLLVMGTSLQVAPMSGVPGLVPHTVPQVLINKNPVQLREAVSGGFDVQLLGDCDAIVEELQRAMAATNDTDANGDVKIERGSDQILKTNNLEGPRFLPLPNAIRSFALPQTEPVNHSAAVPANQTS